MSSTNDLDSTRPLLPSINPHHNPQPRTHLSALAAPFAANSMTLREIFEALTFAALVNLVALIRGGVLGMLVLLVGGGRDGEAGGDFGKAGCGGCEGGEGKGRARKGEGGLEWFLGNRATLSTPIADSVCFAMDPPTSASISLTQRAKIWFIATLFTTFIKITGIFKGTGDDTLDSCVISVLTAIAIAVYSSRHTYFISLLAL
ncbi:hypothetical protein M409DRAFT_25188 [Zasmidium cellare ATCC 36951]|uniref:Uncharacterized protein n=1 Tax=Zasmidium cellare ATCC 36951 TaxID=1080233 RepID=A0A6A6CF58_ZASCE|nr:uncharacterized protein M409DRAFT_25188 [Zasmidium cellare ATCC 36951]KAF2164309.1 hypothetical protein M409DRAFT_25188 [Zasmidium cellare ATCC 36951]